MRPLTPALVAAQRLLETLPKRTHEWTPVRGQWGIKRTPEEDRALRQELIKAEASGMSREDMKATFGISQHTIEKLIGHKTREAK